MPPAERRRPGRLLCRMMAPLLFAAAVHADNVAVLTGADALGGDAWEYQTFDDITPTDYRAVYDAALGADALVADSVRGASGFLRRVKIDLQKTPYLHFRWRVDAAGAGFDEQLKSGDDFAFRIYLVGKTGLVKYRTLDLVRAHGLPRGTHWRSLYSSMISEIQTFVFADASDALGEWHTETLNIADIWRLSFDRDAGNIGGVGIMTDGDNSGVEMKARYGDMVFSDSPASPF